MLVQVCGGARTFAIGLLVCYRIGPGKKLNEKEMKFSYRHSIISQVDAIVVKVELCLYFREKREIVFEQNSYFQKRKLSQPLGTFNAGSIFKKTARQSAGKTIDKLGLKGVKIGQMQISTKHANFFVNLGEATCGDLKKLIQFVKARAKMETGVALEEEIIIIE